MSSRTTRVAGENFDHEGYERAFSHTQRKTIQTYFLPRAAQIDLAQLHQKNYKVAPIPASEFQKKRESLESLWSPKWAFLSMIGLVAPLQKIVKKNDAKNFLHPFFRRIAVPVAAATIGLSAYNAYAFTRDANYDERTASYQAAANVTWQVANNLVLPAVLMKVFSIQAPVPPPINTAELADLQKLGVKPPQMFRTSTLRTYGAFGAAMLIAALTASTTKFSIERWFVQRRFARKDYGSNGHSKETTDLNHDGLFDQLEQWQNEQGDEYLINPTNERAYAELFPFFSLAEAIPTHEVPFNSLHYQNHTPVEYQSALLQGTLSLSQKPGAVPVQSLDTFTHHSKTFGEWSLASPYQLAADKQLVAQPQGRAVLVQVFNEMTPIVTRPAKKVE